jgi:hypothetical protein
VVAAGVDARVLAAAATWFAEADDAGLGDQDYSTILARIIGADRATNDRSHPR